MCVFNIYSLPMANTEREQLKIELQKVNQQITQQTQMHSMEVCVCSYYFFVLLLNEELTNTF